MPASSNSIHHENEEQGLQSLRVPPTITVQDKVVVERVMKSQGAMFNRPIPLLDTQKTAALDPTYSPSSNKTLQNSLTNRLNKNGRTSHRPVDAECIVKNNEGAIIGVRTPEKNTFLEKIGNYGDLLIFAEHFPKVQDTIRGLKREVVEGLKAAPSSGIKIVSADITYEGLQNIRAEKKKNGKQRKPDQPEVMAEGNSNVKNINAAQIADALGFDSKQGGGFELSHLIANCFLGNEAQSIENIGLTTKECNSRQLVEELTILGMIKFFGKITLTCEAVLESGTHLIEKLKLTVKAGGYYEKTFFHDPLIHNSPTDRDHKIVNVYINCDAHRQGSKIIQQQKENYLGKTKSILTEEDKENSLPSANRPNRLSKIKRSLFCEPEELSEEKKTKRLRTEVQAIQEAAKAQQEFLKSFKC